MPASGLPVHPFGGVQQSSQTAENTARQAPGMVAVVQTFGDQLNLHPHVHALVTRGGWTASGEWVPVPYVSSSAAEQLFRHKVIRLLQHAGLLDEDRTRLLLSWHHSGFSVYNFVTVPAGDGRAFEALARYCLRNPVSLARLRWVTLRRRVTPRPPRWPPFAADGPSSLAGCTRSIRSSVPAAEA